MSETASERAARRWRESQAGAPAGGTAAEAEATSAPDRALQQPGDWVVTSAFDASAREAADRQYVYAGSVVAHHYLSSAMKRADRSAAASLISIQPLRSAEEAWAFLSSDGPGPLAAGLRAWRTLTRAALADKAADGRCFAALYRMIWSE